MQGWEAAADAINPWLALALVLLGVIALITQRRALKQVLGLSILLQGALLILVDAGRVHDQMEAIQPLVITALVVEAVVMAIVLVLVINVLRYHPEGLIEDLTELKG